MKNQIRYTLMVAFFMLALQGCEKETTAGYTDIVYYADLQLEGPSPMIVALGNAYVEPGYTATEQEEDVTDKVEVSGSVDSNTPGVYNITYRVTSMDGFTNTATRQVFVLPADALVSEDVAGVYSGQRAGSPLTAAACTISQVEEGAGVYYATDFFGGYYNKVANYGPAYSLAIYFYINADNSVTSLSNTSPWGPWQVLNGTYDAASSTFVHDVEQDGFTFNVTLTKD